MRRSRLLSRRVLVLPFLLQLLSFHLLPELLLQLLLPQLPQLLGVQVLLWGRHVSHALWQPTGSTNTNNTNMHGEKRGFYVFSTANYAYCAYEFVSQCMCFSYNSSSCLAELSCVSVVFANLDMLPSLLSDSGGADCPRVDDESDILASLLSCGSVTGWTLGCFVLGSPTGSSATAAQPCCPSLRTRLVYLALSTAGSPSDRLVRAGSNGGMGYRPRQ